MVNSNLERQHDMPFICLSKREQTRSVNPQTHNRRSSHVSMEACHTLSVSSHSLEQDRHYALRPTVTTCCGQLALRESSAPAVAGSGGGGMEWWLGGTANCTTGVRHCGLVARELGCETGAF